MEVLYNNPRTDDIGTLESDMEIVADNKLYDTHTSLPGYIESFDKETQRAKVQVGVKRHIETDFGTYRQVDELNFPLLLNVPISFPKANGYSFTFPVNKGDECIVFFAERDIAFWKQLGEIQPQQIKWQKHDFSDAYAVVGISSLPNVITDFQSDGMEMRNADRSQYVKLQDNGEAFVKSTTVTVEGNLHVTGDITTDALPNGYNGHTHPYTWTDPGGSGNTSPPTRPTP